MTRLKVFLLLVSLFNLISCDQLNSTKTIRLGHGLSTSHSVHKGMLFFGERLEEISRQVASPMVASQEYSNGTKNHCEEWEVQTKH